MMIDLILIAFVGLVFYTGFWCGHRYTSIREMLKSFLSYTEERD